MIDSVAMAAIRAAAALSLTQTATILHYTEVSDGMGGMTQTWVSAGTSPCRIGAQLNQPQLTQYAAQLGENVGWRVTLEAEADVEVEDRLQVGTRLFEILGILAPGTYETARVCICIER